MARVLFAALSGAMMLSCTQLSPNVGALPEASLSTPSAAHAIFSSGVPAGVSSATSVSIAITNVDTYRSKFAATEAECYDPAGYGVETPVATPIAKNLSAVPDGTIYVCACGKNADGTWQPVEGATFATWTKQTPAPQVLSVTSSSSNRIYVENGVINLAVTFDRDVTVTGGSPVLSLNDGEQAAFVSVSGAVMNFVLTVGPNRFTSVLNVASATALSAGGATIADANAKIADLTLPTSSLSASSHIGVDSYPPIFAPAITYSPIVYGSLAAAPPFGYTASASDVGSGFDHYEISIGTSPSNHSVVPWTAYGGPGVSFGGLSLQEGIYYYPSIRAVDVAGNVSAEIALGAWQPDVTPPVAGAIDDGDFEYQASATPTLKWAAATDNLSGIDRYEVGIGTTPGQTNVTMGFVNPTTSLSAKLVGLSLIRGVKYFATVRVYDVAGNSTDILGDGWTVARPLWITDGTVNAIERVGDSLYVAGNFSVAGPYTGPSALLSTVDGHNLVSGEVAASAAPNGNVNASLVLPAGQTIIGGAFTRVGPNSQGGLALLDAMGNYVAGLPQIDGEVFALAYDAGINILYIGGSFSSVDGVGRSNLAALDLSDLSHPMITGWAPVANGTVKALALDGFDIFAGGSFTQINSTTASMLARLDRSGSVTATIYIGCPASTCDVNTLLADSGSLYLGGGFSSVNSYPRQGLAKLDLSSWSVSTLILHVSAASPSVVYSLAKSGTALYVGGSFGNVTDGFGTTYTVKNLAQVDLASESVSSWNPNLNGPVKTLAISGTSLFVGGSFYKAGSVDQSSFVVYDTATQNLRSFTGRVGKFSEVRSITVSASAIRVSGTFNTAGGFLRANLAKLDLPTGVATTDWMPTSNGTVSAMKASGGKIYVTGGFTLINGSTSANFAALNGSGNIQWSRNFSPAALSVDADAANDLVYIAHGSLVENYDSTGTSVRAAISVSGGVNGVRVIDSDLYIAKATAPGWVVYDSAGTSQTVTGSAGGALSGFTKLHTGEILAYGLSGLSKISALAMSSVGLSLSGSTPLASCAADGGDVVYFGGNFSGVNSQSRPSFASFSVATGVLTAWVPQLSTNYSNVVALKNLGGAIIAGGSVISSNASTAGLGVFDPSTGAQLH